MTKTRYTEEPTGEFRIVEDFLPSPDQLVLKEENVIIAVSWRNTARVCQRTGKVQQVQERSEVPPEVVRKKGAQLLTRLETGVNSLCVDDHSSNRINPWQLGVIG